MSRRTYFGIATALAAVAVAGGGNLAFGKGKPAKGGDQRMACSASGAEVTVALSYDRDKVGGVAATAVTLGFKAPLALPAGAPSELRSRVDSLMPPACQVGPPKLEGEQSVKLTLITSDAELPSKEAFNLRFDCPAGEHVDANALTCKTSEVADAAALPMAPSLAEEVRCTIVRVTPANSTGKRKASR